MFKRSIIILILSVVIFGGLFSYKYYQMQQAIDHRLAPPPAVVAATKVRQLEWQSSLTSVGSLVAVSGVTVTNEIAGIIRTLHFDSGQHVEKGQLLLELDSETDQAELNGLLAEKKLAQIQFNRSKKLMSKDFVSKSDYDQNLALLDENNASVRSKKTIIEKKMIRAPFTGELGIRNVNLGQYLTPGASIVTLQQIAPIYIDFQLPERYLSQLNLDQQVHLSVQAYPDKIFKAKITTISPLIDRNSRSIKIRATLANTGRLLYPGMFAEVQVLSEQSKQVLSLPDTAISYNPYGNFVFIIKSTESGLIVNSRQVETGLSKAGQIEIIKGLKIGDRVVSAGQIKLRNDMAVTLDNKPAPGERNKETEQ